jgi:hypothetical protein
VTGQILRVRWADGEESTVVPSVGSLRVLGKATRQGSSRTAPPRPAKVGAAKSPAKAAKPPAKAAKSAKAPTKVAKAPKSASSKKASGKKTSAK